MQNTIFNHPLTLLKLFASVMYITMGGLVLLYPGAVMNLYNGITLPLTRALGALLIIYGSYRLYRAISDYKEIKASSDDVLDDETE